MAEGLKRLEFNRDGQMTLEGKVVPARRIGPSVMAYWKAEVPKNGGECITDTEKIPVITIPWLPKNANAYALALGRQPVETTINTSEMAPSGVFVSDTEHYRIHARKWTAVQFYRVPKRYLE